MNFTYNGTSASAFGLIVEHRPAYVFPKRVIETIAIPGRSGNLLYDTGAYNNVTVTYQCAYKGAVRANARAIATWLYQNEYCELEDDYDPLYYRKAVFVSPLSVADILNAAGRVNITFDCYPQRYLKTGKTETTYSASTTLSNTGEDALPVITVNGSGNGVLTVGGSVVTITGIGTGIVINSAEQNAQTMNGENANNKISVTGGFPVLANGSTIISWTGGITSIKVIPNWWTL